MRCTKCGVENEENAQYCKNCGNNLSESTSKNKTKNRVPKHIKKIFYSGSLAFFLLFINFFSPKIYSFLIHRTLNGIWGEINSILLILAIFIAVYFYIQVYKIKDEIKMNPDLYYNRMITYLAIGLFLALINPLVVS